MRKSKMRYIILKLMCLYLVSFLLSSCKTSSDYQKPDISDITPSEWHWKIAEPKDTLPKGEWWNIFNDPILNELEKQAVADNQTLRAAVARVDQARAIARLNQSQFFPTLSLDPSYKQERTSGNLPTPIPVDVPSAHLTTYSMPLDLSYEIDLWGRVRRSFESKKAQAEASVSDYQNTLLILTTDIASNYFLILSLDWELTQLQRTVDLYKKSLSILNEFFLSGSIAEIDVIQAKTKLTNSQIELSELTRQRTEVLHTLALLCGKPASSFEIIKQTTISPLPNIPAGLPSSLLERRPDIARAEKMLEAKHAQMSAVHTEYFPIIRLTGQAGYLSTTLDEMFSNDSQIGSIGPSINLPLFTAGRTKARVQEAQANYGEALAIYRQTILTAFKEVEDALAQIMLSNEQLLAQTEVQQSTMRNAELAQARYETGSINFLEQADVEQNRIWQERRNIQIHTQCLIAHIHLIKALGGGWK